MPIITVEVPHADVERKRQLVKELTDSVSKIYKISSEHITVLIKENSAENIGVSGELLSDRMKKQP